MENVTFTIEENLAGQRIDKALSVLEAEWSRSFVQQLIKEKHVLVNGQQVKVNYKCSIEDQIEIQVPDPEPLDVIPEKMNLDIVYEDSDVLVVNKPRGMVVHPAAGHVTGTLVNGLMAHCKDLSGINGILRPGIVHRIDKDTTGLLMVAKNDHAHESLVEQLKAKTTTRKYITIVHGIIPHNEATIDAPIGRDKQDRQKMAIVDNGRDAVTHFKVIESFEEYTLVECQLETGRTHQIRVHMKYIGHPVAGDPKYGPRRTLSINGQALHAAVLGFNHPTTGKYLEFEAPLPEDMNKLLDQLQNNR
jgi:23S rRNA pseudouridine1911/1915/1917 synthase